MCSTENPKVNQVCSFPPSTSCFPRSVAGLEPVPAVNLHSVVAYLCVVAYTIATGKTFHLSGENNRLPFYYR